MEVIAAEYRLCDLHGRLVGRLIFWCGITCLIRCISTSKLKAVRGGRMTQPAARRCCMAIDQLKLVVDQCCTLWCRQAALSGDQTPERCLAQGGQLASLGNASEAVRQGG